MAIRQLSRIAVLAILSCLITLTGCSGLAISSVDERSLTNTYIVATAHDEAIGESVDVLAVDIKNLTESDAYVGMEFIIEMKNGDTWYILPFKRNASFKLVALIIPQNSTIQYNADLSLLKEKLKQGEYRILIPCNDTVTIAHFAVD